MADSVLTVASGWRSQTVNKLNLALIDLVTTGSYH